MAKEIQHIIGILSSIFDFGNIQGEYFQDAVANFQLQNTQEPKHISARGDTFSNHFRNTFIRTPAIQSLQETIPGLEE